MEQAARKRVFKRLKKDENGNLVSPFVWAGKPQEMSASEERDWWKQEFDYWINGYVTKEGYEITGFHYFYMTQIKIKQERGPKIYPWWRDIDEIIIDEWYACKKNQEDLAIYKRRGIGQTAIFVAGLPIYLMITEPGSNHLATSNNSLKTQRMYNEKFLIAFNSLDPWIRPAWDTNRQTGHMTARIKGADGEETGDVSSFLCRQTSDNLADASAFESERAVSAFIDEMFLHRYASDVRQSVQACLMEGGFNKMGPCVFGGSAGLVSQQGIEEAQKIWENSEALRIKTVFIEGFWGVDSAPEFGDDGKPTGKVFNFCPNGHSDIKGASEYIYAAREKLKALKDKKPYNNLKKTYPMEIGDIFELNDVGIVPEDIMQMAVDQKKKITAENIQVNTYELFIDEMSVPKASLARNGDWNILKHPVPGHTYIVGIDPIPIRESNEDNGDRSDYCAIVKDITAQEYVAWFQRRIKDEKVLKRVTLAGQMYYNGAKAMIERNRGGEIMKQYEDDGDYKMLANQPFVFGAKRFDKKEIKGYHHGGYNTDSISSKVFNYLRAHMGNVWIVEIIDLLSKYGVKNTDMLSAMEAAEIYHEDLRKKGGKSSKKTASRTLPVVKTDQFGRRYTEWVTFYTAVEEDDTEDNQDSKKWGRDSLSSTRGR